MIKFFTTAIAILLFLTTKSLAFSSGSGTCVIDEDYKNITLMTDRFRNFNSGTYQVVPNMPEYTAGQPVELTISGPEFTGILFTVVDESGNNVGTFDPEANFVNECVGANPTTPPAAAVTHLSSFGNLTSYTLFWIPPNSNVGKVYVLGYILKGARFDTGSQEFFRFVRDDDSAISLNAQDVFTNSFE
jgi:hypothetical protein